MSAHLFQVMVMLMLDHGGAHSAAYPIHEKDEDVSRTRT